jgi:hypothetical protein
MMTTLACLLRASEGGSGVRKLKFICVLHGNARARLYLGRSCTCTAHLRDWSWDTDRLYTF